MLILTNRLEMELALTRPLPEGLDILLAKHVRHTIDAGLETCTQILAITCTDRIEHFIEELGISILSDVDGLPWTASAFSPRHDWLEAHGGWYTLIVCAGNSGWATIALIQERDDELGKFCRRHANF